MTKKSTYYVNIDMRHSKEYKVVAESRKQAEDIAWNRLKNNLPKKIFSVSSYDE